MEEEKKPDEENKEGMMMEAAPAMEWINMINVPFQYVSNRATINMYLRLLAFGIKSVNVQK